MLTVAYQEEVAHGAASSHPLELDQKARWPYQLAAETRYRGESQQHYHCFVLSQVTEEGSLLAFVDGALLLIEAFEVAATRSQGGHRPCRGSSD